MLLHIITLLSRQRVETTMARAVRSSAVFSAMQQTRPNPYVITGPELVFKAVKVTASGKGASGVIAVITAPEVKHYVIDIWELVC
ncbi:hypothetical protein RRG08_048083 [Elysia crispata]|uniref:Uncharacterized protein n=1 Tax=Elysia crispata TaxID=231223 RepID=A0AAE1B3Q3_9GAST|nr:hypothetical protein RRG08_048083 [Elysia crispata]